VELPAVPVSELPGQLRKDVVSNRHDGAHGDQDLSEQRENDSAEQEQREHLQAARRTAGRVDLPQLSRVLHLAAGITRTAERPYATWLFRAAGSAGGRFPLELYVAVPEGHDVPGGVHWYDPEAHALVRVPPGDQGISAGSVVEALILALP